MKSILLEKKSKKKIYLPQVPRDQWDVEDAGMKPISIALPGGPRIKSCFFF
jgi:hypothetical protein